MARKKIKDADRLTYKLLTHVNQHKYNELQGICDRTSQQDMSKLLRDFLYHRPIKTVTRDMTLDNVYRVNFYSDSYYFKDYAEL